MITERMKAWIASGGNAAEVIDNNPALVSDLNKALREANVIGAAMKIPAVFTMEIVDSDVTVKCVLQNGQNGVGKHTYSPVSEGPYWCLKAVKALILDMLLDVTEEDPAHVHKAVIVVPTAAARKINYLLAHEPADESECMGEDETLVYTAVFDDNRQVDIKLCGVQYDEDNETNVPWTEAVLFDEKGFELCCTDVGEDFYGSWELEYNGETYKVEVIAEETSEGILDLIELLNFEPTDVIMTVSWLNDEMKRVEATATVAEWISDWYGECERCPADDAKVTIVTAMTADETNHLLYLDGGKNVLRFETLMHAIQPTILYQRWECDDESAILCTEPENNTEPRYFIGEVNAKMYADLNSLPLAKAIPCCGICNHCGQPVFPSRDPGVFAHCFHCGAHYADPDDLNDR